MKQLSILLIFVLALGAGYAQDSTKTNITKPNVKKNERPKREDMLLLDFNLNGLANQPDSFDVKLKSWGFGMDVMLDVPINASKFSFAFGAGLMVNSFHTNSELFHINMNSDSAQSKFVPIAENRNVKTNKLTTTYLDIPFELRYRSDPNSKGYSWKVAVGLKVGRHIQTKEKQVEVFNTSTYGYANTANEDPETFDLKTKRFFYPNMEKWRVGINARVAYGRVGFSGYYSLTSLFEQNQGPVINPFSIGITLMPF